MGSSDQKTGAQFQEIIYFSGSEDIKAKTKMGPASSDQKTSPSVNISQQQVSFNPEEHPGIVKAKAPWGRKALEIEKVFDKILDHIIQF